MSFLSVLGKIGHGIQVGLGAVAPFAPAIESIPGVGGPFQVVLSLITMVEQLSPAAGNGASKKAAVMALASMAFPGVDPTALGTFVDQAVALLNAAQKTLPAPAT